VSWCEDFIAAFNTHEVAPMLAITSPEITWEDVSGHIAYEGADGVKSMVELTLNEGKNREIRRMFETLGFEVERLQRVQIGPIKLGQLPRGKWRTLTGPEIKSLMRDSREESPEKKRADDSIHRK